ncbi:MAG TPA: right-handed parallel beta-helix repeat-containing protein [Gammaproteobacteria bacterium]|nr:right-handed parallel beta-helix repeat-containing protein [Gammaproteobacteria bacterium]
MIALESVVKPKCLANNNKIKVFTGVFVVVIMLFVVSSVSAQQTSHADKLKTMLSDYRDMDWSQYTVEAVRRRIPKKMYGSDVESLLSARLYFIGSQNIQEMQEVWQAQGIARPKTIVVANGVYSVADLHRLIDDDSVIEKTKDDTYLFRQPVYVTSTASLVISDATIRLSLLHGVFLVADGQLFIADAVITSWDERAGNEGEREEVPANELLLYGRQTPRPYILMNEGSQIYMANSRVSGLGYKGKRGTFGLSISKRPFVVTHRLHGYIRARAKPAGWLIGNTFTNNFFGFYSNQAEDVILLGNVYYDNVIYNIDPHDYSERLIIARNLTYNARQAHGIIISREVNNSTIAENLSFSNKGSGIMLDRNCSNTLVYSNLTIGNEGDGIAVFESDNNFVVDNITARNVRNGIYVRNSDYINTKNNFIFRNGNAGAETAVVDIDKLETRNFKLDPYHKSASALYEGNQFDSNLHAAMTAKNKGVVTVKNNKFYNSGPIFFGGELAPFAENLWHQNNGATPASEASHIPRQPVSP